MILLNFLSRWRTAFKHQAISPALSPNPARPIRRPGPLRVVAVTRALDEADIIECFIRHTASYVSGHLIIDNGSRDGTIEIIKSLHAEGLPLVVYNNASVSYVEENSNGFLFQHAVTEMEADWVVFLDCDEFIDDRALPGGLIGLLADCAQDRRDKPCLSVPVFNYIPTNADVRDEAIAPMRIQHRLDISHSSHVMLRADQYDHFATIENGAHFVWINGSRLEPHVEPGLVIAHYSDRSPFQILAKAVRGWSKVLAAGERTVSQGTSFHYKGPFDALRDRPDHLLRNAAFIERDHSPEGLSRDAIAYRGGPLRYAPTVDHAMTSVSGLIGFIEGLSVRFGRLVEEVPQAKAFNAALDAQYTPVCGTKTPEARLVPGRST